MKQIVCLLGCFVVFCGAFAQLQPIGNWRIHLPYHQAIAVEAGNSAIYAATPLAIFAVDETDNSLHAYNKLTGLSSTGVSCIALDSSTGKLVIAYSNSDIDIMKDDVVNNINSLKQSSLNGNKHVYDIFCANGTAYVSTGIGIHVIDESRNEVKETYIIGDNGQQLQVNALAMDANFFYAATTQGLRFASVNSSNLSDFHNWQIDFSVPAASDPIKSVIAFTDGQPVILKNDSLYIKQGGGWKLLYASGNVIHSTSKKGNQLVISEGLNTTARIAIINADGSIAQTIQQSSIFSLPLDCKIAGNEVWIADSTNGLIKYSSGTFTPYSPNSPQSIALGDLQINNEALWASAGTVDVNWVPAGNKNGLFLFSKNNWDNFYPANVAALDTLPDVVTLAVEPADQSVWGGSFGGGLFHLNAERSIQVFKQNSPLQSPPSQPGKYNVSGAALDAQHNLWVANYGAAQQLVVRKADGSWRRFTVPFSINENAVSQIVIDDLDQKWIISPKGNGLICFNNGNTIDNTGDDRWRLFRMGPGNGNLPDNNVLSLAKDKNGFIWVGTSSGIGMIPCVTEVFSSLSCEAVIPVVRSGNFTGFLLHDEQVQCITVDGADRKWVGTKNGAWLISADGDQTIFHFTEDASPLLSNDVRKIAINGSTGEVFFATAKGICSFRSTATEGNSTNSNVIVYPNPVSPGYNGPVAIRGLVNNAIVKITELDGRLVYQARAFGGQAIWNGKDYKGNRVSSGVYLVLVTDDNRKENLATKIVFLH